MTDITELALRLKLEAHRAVSNFNPQMNIKTRDLKELVEALEKAQQKIDELENDEVRQRLANAEHQLYMAELAKNNLRASRKAQFRKRKAAEQRIAELESSTVTINVPDARDENYDWDGQTPSEAFNTCRMICTLMFRQSLRAAGIKREAE